LDSRDRSSFDLREWRIRPLVTATAPIYTGGRIEAAREAAAATVRQAEERLTSQSLLVRLVQAYFGQQLAAWTLSVRKDARDGLGQHVENTAALEPGLCHHRATPAGDARTRRGGTRLSAGNPTR
jgi:outer membrane protein TolC